MKIEFICGTFCMIALLLAVLLLTRRRENFSAVPMGGLKNDISGNKPLSVIVQNLSDLAAATPTSLQGKNLPKTIDEATSQEAAEVKSKQDSVAEMRRMIRKELQTQRRFQLPEEDLAEAEMDAENDSVRSRSAKPMMSPALDQGSQFGARHSPQCSDCPNGCESPDYIKKNSIPCWGCSLPASTD
jgi:hypothetical protein